MRADALLIPGVVLAAGASTRLGGGRAKQLLRWHDDGKTLLRRAAEAALAAAGEGVPVVVVLGHRAEEFAAELTGLAVRIVRAEHWAAGMGASLKAGVRGVRELMPNAAGVVVSLCDQPLVTAAHLAVLRDRAGRDSGRVVCAEYGDGLGVPAFFGHEDFKKIAALDDSAGAKGLLRQAEGAGRLVRVRMPEAAADVDTWEDVNRLGGCVEE